MNNSYNYGQPTKKHNSDMPDYTQPVLSKLSMSDLLIVSEIKKLQMMIEENTRLINEFNEKLTRIIK